MIDVNALTEQLLSGLGAPCVYQYPEKFNKLPVVSYYNLSDREDFRTDNAEQSQYVCVQIDIWADTPVQTGTLGLEINKIMQTDGWTRELAMDLPKETAAQIYHRTMRFGKEIYF